MSTNPWLDRVRAADAEAERAYRHALDAGERDEEATARALIAIAAELRAVRIAKRPGAGQ